MRKTKCEKKRSAKKYPCFTPTPRVQCWMKVGCGAQKRFALPSQNFPQHCAGVRGSENRVSRLLAVFRDKIIWISRRCLSGFDPFQESRRNFAQHCAGVRGSGNTDLFREACVAEGGLHGFTVKNSVLRRPVAVCSVLRLETIS